MDGFDRIVICSGHDFETLFPEIFSQTPIQKCKLQMMRTTGQVATWRLGPHLASGLTLRHYKSFRQCQSLQALIDRVSCEAPELDRYGIHVMASQDDSGKVILGDSHEYDSDIEPFDAALIDSLMLRELQKIIRLPSWQIESRWNGTYASSLSPTSLKSFHDQTMEQNARCLELLYSLALPDRPIAERRQGQVARVRNLESKAVQLFRQPLPD